MATARVVVLAAGQGTRMKGGVPKMLEPIAGVPMLHHVLDAVHAAGLRETTVVVGHEGKAVAASAREWAKRRRHPVRVVEQKQQLGTGHAVSQAKGAIGGASEVIVLAGDAPLIRAETLGELLKKHRVSEVSATLVGAEVADPTGYGRILTGSSGNPKRIVEEKDASAGERTIRLVNTGAYCFDRKALFEALPKVGKQNVKGEYYLTDVVGILAASGGAIGLHLCADPIEALGVNDPEQLSAAASAMRRRILSRWMREGVRVDDPATTYLDASVDLAPPLRIRPQTVLEGRTKLASGCDVGPMTVIEDSRLGPNTRVLASVVRGTTLGRDVWVGPYAHLRPGTVVGDAVKIGDFVEIKKTVIGDRSSIGHLAYLGDATLGPDVNVGAGTITANFDGKQKHPTVIGAGSKTGSNTVLVAPLRVGKNVTTGAGAVVTAGTIIPDGTVLVGVPARPLGSKAAKTKRK